MIQPASYIAQEGILLDEEDPKVAMLEFVRQGTVERANPGLQTQGWVWKTCDGLTRRHHRMHIYNNSHAAVEDAKRLCREDFVRVARVPWDERDTTQSAPRWRTIAWSKWCQRCGRAHATRN